MNNEVIHPEFERYRNNIRKLNAFVLIEWDSDNILIPRQTELFDKFKILDKNEPKLKRDFSSSFHAENLKHDSKFKVVKT